MKPTWIAFLIIALLLVSVLIGCTAQDPASSSSDSSYTWYGEITTETEPEADMKTATLPCCRAKHLDAAIQNKNP